MNRYSMVITVNGADTLHKITASDWQTAEMLATDALDHKYGTGNWAYKVKPMIQKRSARTSR